ncbi:MAG TPA: sulfatase-like hydrolase/transferase [Opitutaceae bacterium]|nr:sulfatase-like hydrolase/transferase [Opitutaceae bacterium]
MKSYLGLLILALAAAVPARGATATKPNIIFILADDFGITNLGCTGGIYRSPNLDALAQSGTLFENAFSAPLCAPTRATLISGRYIFRTGVKNNGLGSAATPEKDGCVALRLKQAGYATAVVGKWRHLSHFTTKADAVKWGFDEFMIWGAGLPDDEDDDAATRAAKKAKEKTGQGAKGDLPARGDRYWTPDYNLNGKMLEDAQGKYGPEVLNDYAIDFIRRHKDGPFFIYYPTPLTHGPIMATPDSKEQDRKKKTTGKKMLAETPGPDSLYADNIAYLDKLVGKLVAELDALQLRENTLIIFAGDNGSVPIGTVRGRIVDGKKGNMTEGGSRVPFITNWRGTTPAGVVRKDLIDFSDVLPTLCELAGVKPADGLKIDGKSFAGALRGEPGVARETIYIQLNENRYVRSDRWKLNNAGELFDMKDAPYAELAVAKDTADPEAKAARVKLQAALDRVMADDPNREAVPKQKKKKK